MSARPRPRDREIDHLRGKDEGAEDPHQGDRPIVDLHLQPLRGIPRYGRRSRPHRRPHGGGEQGICHVHLRISFSLFLIKKIPLSQ